MPQKKSTPLVKTDSHNFPLVSVIIRTKDRPDCLKRALKSILEQDYPNIELVIINDAGLCVNNLLVDAKKRLKHLQYVVLEKNLGRAGAANSGLEHCTGDFVQFLDDDDELDSCHISKHIDFMTRQKSKVCYSNIRTEAEVIFDQEFSKEFLYIGNYIPIHAVIFSRTFIDMGIRMDENFPVYEDWDFWLQICQHCNFDHLPIVTGTYHTQGMSGAGMNNNQEISYINKLAVYAKWSVKWESADIDNIFSYMLKKQNDLVEESKDKIAIQVENVIERDKSIIDLQHQIHQLNIENKDFILKVNKLEVQENKLQRQKNSLQSDVEQKQQQIVVAQQVREELELCITTMRESTSWKVTKPLRTTKEFISRRKGQ